MAVNSRGGVVNFNSYIEGGVDPRTGTFSQNILLASLHEPDFDIRLVYSPLNLDRVGFGLGWHIAITMFDVGTKTLKLSTGQVFSMVLVSNKWKINDQQYDVKFEASGAGYKITYRSGMVELLTPTLLDWNSYVCTRVFSPAGRMLKLEWGGDGRIDKIRSGKNVALCSFAYSLTGTRLEVWPGTTSSRVFRSVVASGLMREFRNESLAEHLIWRFLYVTPMLYGAGAVVDAAARALVYGNSEYGDDLDAIVTEAYLRKMTLPTGKVEAVEYSPEVTMLMKYELYRVIDHTVTAGSSGSVVKTKYHYLNSYMEAQLGACQEYAVCVERVDEGFSSSKVGRYNKFGLLLEEVEYDASFKGFGVADGIVGSLEGVIKFSREFGNVGVYKKQEFPVNVSLPATSQPEVFRSPYQVYIITTVQGQTFDQELTHRYDVGGRLIQQINTDGSRDNYEYASDETSFQTLLLVRSHEPAKTAYESPTRKTSYSYLSLPVADEGKAAVNELYVKCFERTADVTRVDGGEVEKVITFDAFKYVDAPLTQSHGRLLLENNAVIPEGYTFSYLPGPIVYMPRWEIVCKSVADYNVNTAEYSYSYADDSWTLSKQVTSYDGLLASYSMRRRSTDFTPVTEINNGAQIGYGWDKLGRLVELVSHQASPYAQSVRSVYGVVKASNYSAILGNTGNGPKGVFDTYQISTDPQGVKELKGYDLVGRHVQTWTSTPDLFTGQWFVKQEVAYDTFGRILMDKLFDYDPALSAADRVLANYSFNSVSNLYVGLLERITTTKGQAVERIAYDPVVRKRRTLTTESELYLSSFTYEGNSFVRATKFTGCPVLGGVYKDEWFDLRGDLIKEEVRQLTWVDGNAVLNESLFTKVYEYDGLKRLRDSVNEKGGKTSFYYDRSSRLVKTVKADGSAETRGYPKNTTKSLLSTMSVIDVGGKTTSVCAQEYDGLGRMTKRNNYGREYVYGYDSSLEVEPTSLRMPDGNSLDFENISELNGAPGKLTAPGVENNFTYVPSTGHLSGFSGSNGYSTKRTFNRQGGVIKEQYSSPVGSAEASRQYSLQGVPLSYKGVDGVSQSRSYDSFGRLIVVQDADVKMTQAYDNFGRVIKKSMSKKNAAITLVSSNTYDFTGQLINVDTVLEQNNISRQLSVLELTYENNGRLATRKTTHELGQISLESFTYDVIGRPVTYACSGGMLPPDGWGKTIQKQDFNYDVFNNIIECRTYFDGGMNTAKFVYGNTDDPTQLTRITHSHADYPSSVDFTYDANGCMVRDQAGREFAYDVMGRLKAVTADGKTINYAYDAMGKLVAKVEPLTPPQATEWFYNEEGKLPLLVNQSGSEQIRIVKTNRQTAGLVTAKNGSQKVQMTSADGLGSLRLSVDGDASAQALMYSAFGCNTQVPVVGYTDQHFDPFSGCYQLGARQYNPVLGRFLSMDSMSPSGPGGVNGYAYVDPINFADPAGHLSLWSWIAIGIGVAITVASLGTLASIGIGLVAGSTAFSLGVGLAIGSAAAGVASGGFAIAAGAIQESNPALAEKLSYVSLGFGFLSFGLGIGAAKAVGWLASRSSSMATIRYTPTSVGLLGDSLQGGAVAVRGAPLMLGETSLGNAVSFTSGIQSTLSAAFTDLTIAVARTSAAQLALMPIVGVGGLAVGNAGYWNGYWHTHGQ
ncbi:RHS repeat-associated core domain-containing protein [Pseudomonas purpurea]|uniref:RHS repeat-associated core domain-containing protein n=1 Tax=Pseudomonas purpurea TaxID=3136737 RepID=UPI00326735EE